MDERFDELPPFINQIEGHEKRIQLSRREATENDLCQAQVLVVYIGGVRFE